jgi:small subunit ribosomal protein S18
MAKAQVKETEANTTASTEESAGEARTAARPERHNPRLLGKSYFQRKKNCPFTGPRARTIDYKDVKTLQRYVSPYGKIMPAHMTGVSAKAQRQLKIAIKRARMIGLMPFTDRETR